MIALRFGSNTCGYREMHPSWEYKLWTDEANRDLVKEHYPWLLEVYDGFPENIMRADTARVLYMHHYGGAPFLSWALHLLPGVRLLLFSLVANVQG
jgi:hypothetical protein